MSKRIKRLQKVWVGLPKRIKVGPTWYVVKFDQDLTHDDGKSLEGMASEHDSTITLRPDLSYSHARNAVLHEVMHCIRFHTLIDHPEAIDRFSDMDEAIALSFTPYLLMVIQDNPGLIDWLQKPEFEEE